MSADSLGGGSTGTVLRMKDGFDYELSPASTSNSRAWVAFDERGNPCGVLCWKTSGLSKRIAHGMLTRRWPYATSVQAAKRRLPAASDTEASV